MGSGPVKLSEVWRGRLVYRTAGLAAYERMATPSRLLAILRITIAVAVVYLNFAVLLRTFHVPAPAPLVLYDLFKMNHMFEGAPSENYDVRVLGQIEGREEWIDLHAEKTVSPLRGRRLIKLLASRHSNTFGPDAAAQAQGFLADKLRQKYNREHPESPIVRMKFELVAWPLGVKQPPAGARRSDLHTWELARGE